ncbi:MAG TPA: NAD-dependent epimerase/dehydratase family protein, partial [Candidatus Acidoferrum sp.]|nr:NAD-dependent epimerase/dehydratase family protein [Candidatus Acidoferrum sp.]
MSTRRIILGGGSGFLGQRIATFLQPLGWEPVILSRSSDSKARFREMQWDAKTVGPWVDTLDGAEAVINLTGRSVNCRYTAKNRRAIMDSRVDSTRVVGEAIARCSQPPRTWLNASTATLYQHTFGPAHDETSTAFGATIDAKDAFSVSVGRAWEKALTDALVPQTRKVALRATIVFGTVRGGVFQVMRRLAKLGLGGRMGSGHQYVSWIHEEDFCRAVEWVLTHEELSGPVNIAAPNPLANAEMMAS